ncbi:testicular haploid expressed gene protein-like [Notechis scutatus]|uniref:Testicular haploid expressed gene protein-like n=1 Tax=Notechis scutatus TaxID=8663 RepID=A0A6J1VIU5_9SAUR|nr:testicular haploid expressed gene protein-like [Notechis scutatus]
MPSEWGLKQDRLSILARPKVNHQVLLSRPSVYWVDKIPKEQPRYTIPVMTSRQEELSEFKMVHPSYKYNRFFPETSVTPTALNVVASPRLNNLSRPRPVTDISELNNLNWFMVRKGALTAVPTPRIIALAKPKCSPTTSEKPHKKRHPVPTEEKLEQLSRPRVYIFEAHDPYKVSKAALKYDPSPRIIEISRPTRVRGRII